MTRGRWIALIVAAVVLSSSALLFLRSRAPAGVFRKGNIEIAVWPIDFPEYISLGNNTASEANHVCVGALTEDYKKFYLMVLTPESSGFTVASKLEVPVKKNWGVNLLLDTGEVVSSDYTNKTSKDAPWSNVVYSRHDPKTAGYLPKPLESFRPTAYQPKRFLKRYVLYDKGELVELFVEDHQLVVERMTPAKSLWRKKHSEVLELAPLYIEGELNYVAIKLDGGVFRIMHHDGDLARHDDLPSIPDDLLNDLQSSRASQVALAAGLVVWTHRVKGSPGTVRIWSDEGDTITIHRIDPYDARSPLRVIPKLRRIEEKLRTAPQTTDSFLKRDGQRQPTNVVSKSSQIRPLNDLEIIVTDSHYQRITTIRKAD